MESSNMNRKHLYLSSSPNVGELSGLRDQVEFQLRQLAETQQDRDFAQTELEILKRRITELAADFEREGHIAVAILVRNLAGSK
jgi:hypothetical protein